MVSIQFSSSVKKVSPSERDYAVVEKECFAIIWAVKSLRMYLEGKPFQIENDHALCSGYKGQICQTRGCNDGVSFCRNLYLRSSIFVVLRIQWQALCRG